MKLGLNSSASAGLMRISRSQGLGVATINSVEDTTAHPPATTPGCVRLLASLPGSSQSGHTDPTASPRVRLGGGKCPKLKREPAEEMLSPASGHSTVNAGLGEC